MEKDNKDTLKMINSTLYLMNQPLFERRSRWYDTDQEVNNEPSKTIQGQSYSIAELLIKHATGVFPAVIRNDEYDENPNFEEISFGEISRLEKTELENFIESNGQRINELRKLLTMERVNKEVESPEPEV